MDGKEQSAHKNSIHCDKNFTLQLIMSSLIVSWFDTCNFKLNLRIQCKLKV